MVALRVWVLVVAAVAMAPGGWGQEPVGEGAQRPLVMCVVAADGGAPLAGVNLTLQSGSTQQSLRSDEAGRAEFVLAAGARYPVVKASAPGRVSMAIWWGPDAPHPESYTLSLPRGASIGGRVLDPDGQAVAGARVFLSWQQNGEPGRPSVSFWNVAREADEQGRWEADFLPDPLTHLSLRVEHPRFRTGSWMRDTVRTLPSVDALRAKQAELVVERGVRLAGRVVGADGEPVAGASVSAGVARWNHLNLRTESGEDGRFVFLNAQPEEQRVLVTAPGHGPALTRTPLDGAGLEVGDIMLPGPHTLRGEVVDAAGDPVAGAMVAVGGWREGVGFDQRFRTDERGRWAWESAPPDAVKVAVLAEGKLWQRDLGLAAADGLHRVVLQDALSVRGAVTDADTGEPLKSFVVETGRTWRDETTPRFDGRGRRAVTGGDYTVSFNEPGGAKHVAVSAPGYARVVSPGFDVQGDERSVVFDVALQREAGLRGRVVDAQGHAVLGATIKIIKPGTYPSVINGRLIYGREGADRTQSAEDGGFWLPAPGHEYLLLVLHDRGIARVPQSAFRRRSEIRLEPWAQIQGTVWIDGKPAANTAVRGNTLAKGYRDGRAWIEVFYETTTDAQGRFSLDRVAPGSLILGRVVTDENSSRTQDNVRPQIGPGEQVELRIGDGEG